MGKGNNNRGNKEIKNQKKLKLKILQQLIQISLKPR